MTKKPALPLRLEYIPDNVYLPFEIYDAGGRWIGFASTAWGGRRLIRRIMRRIAKADRINAKLAARNG